SPVGLSNFQQTCSGFFAHQYPFQQVDHMLQDETAIPSSINLGGVEGAFVKYWDDSAMVAILEFKVEARPQPQVQASTGPTKEKKGKKKKDDTSNKLPISDKLVTLSFNKGGPGSKLITSLPGSKALAQISLCFSAEDFAAEDDDAEAATSVEDNKGSFTVQEELNSNARVPVCRCQSAASRHTVSKFSDTNALTCLLCAWAFNSHDQLKRHNKESDLHEVQIARQKVVAACQAADSKIMHNQPDVPLPENAGSLVSKKRRHAEGLSPPPSPPPAINPGQDDANVGNKLLKMMGWKEGSGLGTDGEGRVDPLTAPIYTGYVHHDMAQDAVKERFESLCQTALAL
ncbi:hypothetical protein M405DRAFT_830825, partial [Rhizopogon salebrosus TDB-379]